MQRRPRSDYFQDIPIESLDYGDDSVSDDAKSNDKAEVNHKSTILTSGLLQQFQIDFGRPDVINYGYQQRSNGKELSHSDADYYRDLTVPSADDEQAYKGHKTDATVGAARVKGKDNLFTKSTGSNLETKHLFGQNSNQIDPSTSGPPKQYRRQHQHPPDPRIQQQSQQHRRRTSSSLPKAEKDKSKRSHPSARGITHPPLQGRAKDTLSGYENKDNGSADSKVMNNYTSPLDGQYAMANNNMTRQAPTPNQGQHQSNGIVGSSNVSNAHNSNGINGNVGNSSSIGTGGAVGGGNNGTAGVGAGMGLLNGLPSAGHQTDMNYLWSVVQQLSEVLADNRAQTAGIVRSVQHLQTRAAAEGLSPILGETNGEVTGTSILSSSNGSVSNNNNTTTTTSSSSNHQSTNSTFPPSSSQNTTSSANASASTNTAAAAATSPTAADLLSLQTLLTASDRRATALESHTADLRSLLNDYEAAMQLILDKLRTYAYNHTHALIALHAHYNSLLTVERNTNLELRLEHQGWQAGLARVAEYARVALREQADGKLPYLRRIAALKAENRVLRSLAGWEAGSEGDGSESGSEVDGEREFERLGNFHGTDLERERERNGKREREENEREEQRLVGTLLG